MITSGPTWVAIDRVRVISNTASGKTGILLANQFAQAKAKVTLLMGPVGEVSGLNKKIRIRRFCFFQELSALLKDELKNKYDIIVQAAAVSDYAPKSMHQGKISSRKQVLKLNLKSTPKLINCLRKLAPCAFLVGFKFEPELAGGKLIREARSLNKKAGLDLTVANSFKGHRYQAYLVDNNASCGPYRSKEVMARSLTRLIERKYARK